MDGKHRHKTHSFLQRNVDGVQTKETIILGLCTVHSIKLIYCSLLSQRVCYASAVLNSHQRVTKDEWSVWPVVDPDCLQYLNEDTQF